MAAALALAVFITAWPCRTEAADSSAKIVFSAGVPDSNGCFQLSMKVFNAKFAAFQFALRFDPTVVKPVDAGTENTADDFDGFAVMDASAAKWMSEAGTELDAKAGYFTFAGYVTPGQTVPNGVIDSDKLAEAGSSGLSLFTFNFKTLKSGDMGLGLATGDKGKPFNETVPAGVIFMNYSTAIAADISFDLPNSLGNSTTANIAGGVPISVSTASDVMTESGREKDVILLQLGNYAATVHGGVLRHIDSENKAVVPYLSNDRTMVPVRFIAEALGAVVDWESGADGFTIKYGDKQIKMTFDSPTFTVNGSDYTYDAPVEVRNDRTMVPVRFISEILGQSVYWDADNQCVIITPACCPWQPGRAAEKLALSDMLTLISPLVRDFSVS